MATLVEFETRDEKLKKDIETQIGALAKVAPPALPPADAAITKLYIKKIEGDYDVSRAKQDTDNAIDLLYIAYNATPQTEVDIRTQIHGIMDSLVKAQQASESAMHRVHLAAGNVLSEVDAYFPDWLDARQCEGPKDVAGTKTLKAFLADDLIALAKAIKRQALAVGAVLDGVATTYNAILKDTENVTKKSETALAGRLKDATAVRKQIAASQAKRDQLEKLVEDLKLEVEKYDRLAKEYEVEGQNRGGARVYPVDHKVCALDSGWRDPAHRQGVDIFGRRRRVSCLGDTEHGEPGRRGQKRDRREEEP